MSDAVNDQTSGEKDERSGSKQLSLAKRIGRVAFAIGLIGRVLVLAGLLILFYGIFLLVGTNAEFKGAQHQLGEQLAAAVPAAQPASPGQVPPARPAAKPKPGDPLFTLVMPKIGVRSHVVEGVGVEELKKGPGHFVDKPFPGEPGNVAISGHRTTFGAPFFNIDKLEAGDQIIVESGPYRYRYSVNEKIIVAPTAVQVVENRGRDELTLTTCHPRFSASQRLIIHAGYLGGEVMQSAPPPASKQPRQPATPGGGEEELVPAPPPAVPMETIVLGAIALVSALVSLGLTRRMRPLAVWSAASIFVGVVLWTTVFPQVLRLMPANY